MKLHLLKPGENPLEMQRPRGDGKGMLFVYGALIILLLCGIVYGIYSFFAPKPVLVQPSATPTLTETYAPTQTLMVDNSHVQRTPLASRSQHTPTLTATPKTRFITVPAEVTRERTVVVTKVISGPVQVVTKVIKETVVVVVVTTPTLTPTPTLTATPTASPTPTPSNTPRHSPPTPAPTPTLYYTPVFFLYLPVVSFNAPAIDTPILPPPSSEPGPTPTPGAEPVEWPAATGTPIPSETMP